MGTNAVPGNLTIGDGIGVAKADKVIIRNNDQIADTSNVTIASSGLLDLDSFNTSETIGSLAGSGAVDLGPTSVLTVSGATSTAFSGTISGAGGITKSGASTLSLSGIHTFSGTTTVSGGTLEVSGTGALLNTSAVALNTGGTLLLSSTTADRVIDLATVTLNGGTLNTGGLNETVGALTMTASSVIDMGSPASLLTFANAGTTAWSGTLSVWNWTGIQFLGGGTDQLLLTSAATNSNITFANINFFSGSGIGQIGFGSAFVPNGFGGGEIVPVPEPSSVATVMGLLGLIGWRERRKVAHARQAARSAK